MSSKRKILTGAYVVLGVLATVPLMGSSGGCDNKEGTFMCVLTQSPSQILPNNAAGQLQCQLLQAQDNIQSQANKFAQSSQGRSW